MAIGGEVCWHRSFAGRNPSRIAIAADIVACSYVDDQGQPGTPGRHRLVCLDLSGEERWSVRDFQLELALPDGRLVGTTQSGKLRTLDVNGRKYDGLRDGKNVRCTEVAEVTQANERVHVLTKRELIVADRELNVIDRWPAPSRDRAVLAGDGTAFVVQKGSIVRWNKRGAAEALCPIPVDMANEAMSRWEKETGIPALHGVTLIRIDANAEFTSELVASVSDRSRERLAHVLLASNATTSCCTTTTTRSVSS